MVQSSITCSMGLLPVLRKQCSKDSKEQNILGVVDMLSHLLSLFSRRGVVVSWAAAFYDMNSQEVRNT